MVMSFETLLDKEAIGASVEELRGVFARTFATGTSAEFALYALLTVEINGVGTAIPVTQGAGTVATARSDRSLLVADPGEST